MPTQDSTNPHWFGRQRDARWVFYLLLALQALLFLVWVGVLVASWTTRSTQLTTDANLMMAGIGLLFLLESGYLFLWPQPPRTRTGNGALLKALPIFPLAMGAGFLLRGLLQAAFPTSWVPSLLAAACIFAGIALFFHLMRKAASPE